MTPLCEAPGDCPHHDAPAFVRYRIDTTTIDGAPIPAGTEVGLKVLAVVGTGADVTDRTLRIVDWAGPWREKHNDPDPPAIPEHVLRAATFAVTRRLTDGNLPVAAVGSGGVREIAQAYDVIAEAVARAALEAAALLRGTPA